MPHSKKITQLISNAVDQSIIDFNEKKGKRTYLGGSSLGESCSRKIQYRYMGYEADEGREFSANTLRIFQFGHEIEDSVAQWLKNANFDLRTEDKKGEQFGFSIADGEIKGHIDGVICGGPVDMGYPCLWENKSANDKKFREFMMKGVVRTNPVYAAQIALYQAYMNLTEHPCLFTVLNKNTSQIYYELVPFNKVLAQEISDKAVNILEATKANEILPRIAFSRDFYDCKWCEFQDKCWS
jgi:hypothetical protein